MFATLIEKLHRRQDLSVDEAAAVMGEIMAGRASPAQIAGLLIALSMKGERPSEIVGLAMTMRANAVTLSKPYDGLFDTCGTGGDGANLFNVSTASAFVAAAAGCRVAKHGNRSVSSKSGSSDLLEEAGIRLDLSPNEVAQCVDAVGVGFMFAPSHHSAMKYAIGPRKELGMRTLFNILGPLTNPASAPNQLLGVYSAKLLPLMAEVLKRLGSEHVLVVHAEDGLDEISLAAPTHVAELKNGEITEYTITPEDFGIERQSLSSLKVTTAEESLALVKQSLVGEGPAADIVALNAGAALYASGVPDTLKEGVLMAQDSQASKLPAEKLKELADFTRVFAA